MGPRRSRSRALGPTLIILVVLIVAFILVSRVWTDWLWFRSLGASEVFTTRWLTSLALFFGVGVSMGGGVAAAMWVAWRVRPRHGGTHNSETLQRYNDVLNRRTMLVVAVVAGLFGVLAGANALSHVDQTLAMFHASTFGTTDPYFGIDIGFFVFRLPFLQYVAGVIMAILICATIAAAGVHLVTGALHTNPVRLSTVVDERGMQTPRIQLSNPFGATAQSHLSIMLGLILVWYGALQVLGRYGYATSDNDPLFTGIGYTDDHSRLNARLVVAIISLICGGVFFATARMRRWRLPVAALVLMLASAIIVQGIYPGVVQYFGVRPNEPDRERPYIQNQIAATRRAYGIDQVQISDYSAKTDVSAGQLKADAEALPGIRLMDPAIVAPTFEQLQQVRGYYSFPSILDVDRYTVDGQVTDSIVAAREISTAGLPADNRTWNNIHTVYTHGYGMVAAYGNRRQASGEPVWLEGDIPTTGVLNETQPRIYYGESADQFVLVGAPAGTPPVELDTPGGGQQGSEQKVTYTGTGGVAVGNPLVRAMYAVRFGDINLLLSGRVNSETKILYDRTPRQMVAQVAPWLTLDSDPYPAVVDGRIVWILDGYTTSNSYPNSQRNNLASTISDSTSATRGLGVPGTEINYIRNSVKGYIDAYDGTLRLYAWDTSDPLLQTWMKVYPGLLRPASEIPASLKAHFRYPQDIFKVQRQLLSRYHMTDPDSWYQQADLWRIPQDPRDKNGALEPPYYLSIRWPDDSGALFSQTTSFTPNNRENLGAYMSVVADASSPDYGKIRVLKLSDSQQVPGPNQTYNAIVTDAGVAAKLLPFVGQGGSGSATPLYGNLLTLPLGGGLIYVEPIYTQRKDTAAGSASGSYPVLRFVVVRFGDHIGIGDTLQEALDTVFSGSAGASTGETAPSPGPGGTASPSPGGGASAPESTPGPSGSPSAAPSPSPNDQAAQQALTAAQQAFAAADAALKAGDLATYQQQIQVAQQKVAEAAQALAG